MTLCSGPRGLELLRRSYHFQMGWIRQDGLASNATLARTLNPSTPSMEYGPSLENVVFCNDLYFVLAESSVTAVQGCDASRLVQSSKVFAEMLLGGMHSRMEPAVIELDREDFEGISLFLEFMMDPVHTSAFMTGEDLLDPEDVIAAWRFATKYDAPVVALHIKQYGRSAPYGYKMLGDTESATTYPDRPNNADRSPLSNDYRLAAFVLGAQLDDPIMCARMLEAGGGTDAFVQPETGLYLRDGAWESDRVRERYEGGQAERCHLFDVSGWPLKTLNAVGTKYAGALMRAQRTVGAYYREPDWAAESDQQFFLVGYGEKIGDWTWSEVAHEFRGYLGLHALGNMDAPNDYNPASYQGSRFGPLQTLVTDATRDAERHRRHKRIRF